MKFVDTTRAHLSRRVGPSFADMAIAANAAYGYPDGWGTSPRRAPADTGQVIQARPRRLPGHACAGQPQAGALT